MLQFLQSQRESWPNLLQINRFELLVENVTMMSEKYKISLIVHRNDSPSFKVWLLREQRSKEPSNSSTQSRIEILQVQLWEMISWVSVMPDFFV